MWPVQRIDANGRSSSQRFQPGRRRFQRPAQGSLRSEAGKPIRFCFGPNVQEAGEQGENGNSFGSSRKLGRQQLQRSMRQRHLPTFALVTSIFQLFVSAGPCFPIPCPQYNYPSSPNLPSLHCAEAMTDTSPKQTERRPDQTQKLEGIEVGRVTS